jgi:predicted molibdopterin-dependent oxidoreductase YjgC
MLAVHLDYDEEARKRVSSFWKSDSLPEAPGLSALEIFEAAERGEIDILVICHTDPIYHLPNRERMQRAISKVSLVVEINAYDDSETASFAHIRLPATPWGEKNATQTNLDRTITRQNAFFPPSGEARHDWEIFCEIGRRLEYGEAFGYSGVEEIFEEYAEMTRLSGRGHLNIYDCDYEKLAKEPFVWGEGFMRENRFMREGGKAGIFFVENRRLHEKCDDRYPLILITGRTRDQWHSGTKTAGVERLRRYKALEFIEIHPDDARRFSIDDSQMVRVRSARGSVELPAKITESVGRGRVFIPLSVRGVNYLTSDLKDPVSKEPDYKYAAVSLQKID